MADDCGEQMYLSALTFTANVEDGGLVVTLLWFLKYRITHKPQQFI